MPKGCQASSWGRSGIGLGFSLLHLCSSCCTAISIQEKDTWSSKRRSPWKPICCFLSAAVCSSSSELSGCLTAELTSAGGWRLQEPLGSQLPVGWAQITPNHSESSLDPVMSLKLRLTRVAPRNYQNAEQFLPIVDNPHLDLTLGRARGTAQGPRDGSRRKQFWTLFLPQAMCVALDKSHPFSGPSISHCRPKEAAGLAFQSKQVWDSYSEVILKQFRSSVLPFLIFSTLDFFKEKYTGLGSEAMRRLCDLH